MALAACSQGEWRRLWCIEPSYSSTTRVIQVALKLPSLPLLAEHGESEVVLDDVGGEPQLVVVRNEVADLGQLGDVPDIAVSSEPEGDAPSLHCASGIPAPAGTKRGTFVSERMRRLEQGGEVDPQSATT
jgi:hypothetical protein